MRPHTVGQRVCSVQALYRRQNLGAGAIHLPQAFEKSQDSKKTTTPNGVVVFLEHRNTIDATDFGESNMLFTENNLII